MSLGRVKYEDLGAGMYEEEDGECEPFWPPLPRIRCRIKGLMRPMSGVILPRCSQAVPSLIVSLTPPAHCSCARSSPPPFPSRLIRPRPRPATFDDPPAVVRDGGQGVGSPLAADV